MGVPQMDGSVRTSTSNGAAVGTEGNAPDRPRMPH